MLDKPRMRKSRSSSRFRPWVQEKPTKVKVKRSQSVLLRVDANMDVDVETIAWSRSRHEMVRRKKTKKEIIRDRRLLKREQAEVNPQPQLQQQQQPKRQEQPQAKRQEQRQEQRQKERVEESETEANVNATDGDRESGCDEGSQPNVDEDKQVKKESGAKRPASGRRSRSTSSLPKATAGDVAALSGSVHSGVGHIKHNSTGPFQFPGRVRRSLSIATDKASRRAERRELMEFARYQREDLVVLDGKRLKEEKSASASRLSNASSATITPVVGSDSKNQGASNSSTSKLSSVSGEQTPPSPPSEAAATPSVASLATTPPRGKAGTTVVTEADTANQRLCAGVIQVVRAEEKTLSVTQARRAFGRFLVLLHTRLDKMLQIHLQQRLGRNQGKPGEEGDGMKDGAEKGMESVPKTQAKAAPLPKESELKLICTFLKRASANFDYNFVFQPPTPTMTPEERLTCVSSQLGRFVDVYLKESVIVIQNEKREVNRKPEVEALTYISGKTFDAFLSMATEKEVEELLTYHARAKKSIDMFFGPPMNVNKTKDSVEQQFSSRPLSNRRVSSNTTVSKWMQQQQQQQRQMMEQHHHNLAQKKKIEQRSHVMAIERLDRPNVKAKLQSLGF